jgi:hypothetical protein
MRHIALSLLLLTCLLGGAAQALPPGGKVVVKDGVKVTTWRRANGEHVTHEAGINAAGQRFFKLRTDNGMVTTERTVLIHKDGKTTVDHESVETFNAGGSHTKRLHRVVRGGDAKENSFSTETLAGDGMNFVYETEHVQDGVSHKVQRVNGIKVEDQRQRREVPASWQAAQE